MLWTDDGQVWASDNNGSACFIKQHVFVWACYGQKMVMSWQVITRDQLVLLNNMCLYRHVMGR